MMLQRTQSRRAYLEQRTSPLDGGYARMALAFASVALRGAAFSLRRRSKRGGSAALGPHRPGLSDNIHDSSRAFK